jgi:hypothetical protein
MNPIDVMRVATSTDVVCVGIVLDVQRRYLADYAALGGEVSCG